MCSSQSCFGDHNIRTLMNCLSDRWSLGNKGSKIILPELYCFGERREYRCQVCWLLGKMKSVYIISQSQTKTGSLRFWWVEQARTFWFNLYSHFLKIWSRKYSCQQCSKKQKNSCLSKASTVLNWFLCRFAWDMKLPLFHVLDYILSREVDLCVLKV